MRPSISAIVLSYFKIHRLRPCLRSLLEVMDLERDELLVIDNTLKPGKEDESKEVREYLKLFEKHNSPARVMFNKRNMKFSKTVNQGIRNTNREYILLINNDTEVVDKTSIDKLVKLADSDKRIATVTPVSVRSNGTVYCSGAYGGGCHRQDKPGKVRHAEWNNFAFVCIKRSVLDEIGYLVEGISNIKGRRYNCGHYHSDEEWCRRASRKGYLHLVHPTVVMHYHGEG